jgi:hypothetical protein
MTNTLDRLLHTNIEWQPSQGSKYLFQYVFENRIVWLRLNDFPQEPLCTVILDGIEEDLSDFPKLWTLPRHRDRRG